MLIFLDSGLYSPRPSKPTPRKAAPSIMFWKRNDHQQNVNLFVCSLLLFFCFALHNNNNNNNSIYLNTIKSSAKLWSCTINKIRPNLNHNKTTVRILRIYNICGLKVHLSGFLKASVSQIYLISFSRTFHRIIGLYEHVFLIILVVNLGSLKVILLLKSYLLSYFTIRQLMGHGKRW